MRDPLLGSDVGAEGEARLVERVLTGLALVAGLMLVAALLSEFLTALTAPGSR